ncbi:sensor histidine kinase [Phytoactinopolyspora limicola]|uniref:sensor histidine kinase n=1 Tax=Phytoactinopolyspora limicola TaxID=2715536 RepID=UPI00140E8398|nr:nitrate- and nitrite sensing domain-containing protein [Phytoactinopolyspora limicola]
MTRTARGRRGTSADPKRARTTQDSSERAQPPQAGGREDSRPTFWHTLLHDRSVRSRVAALVIVPLLGTLILGTLFFKNALDDAGSAAEVERLASVGIAATDLLHRIQDERDISGMAEADATGVSAVAEARDNTDSAVQRFREQLGDVRSAGGGAAVLADAFEQDIAQLQDYRSERDAAEPAFDAGGAAAYHEVAESVRAIVTASGLVVDDGETTRLISGLDNISQAVEAASMERALVAYHLDPGESASSALTTSAVVYRGQQDLLLGRYLTSIDDPAVADSVASRLAGADDLTTDTLDAIRAGDDVGQSHDEWFAAATDRLDTLRSVENEAAENVVSEASSAANGARMTAILSAVAVLLVLGLTVFLTVVVARSIVGPLRRLRGAAEQTATHDLPTVVERIQRDGPAAATDLDSSSEVITAEGDDEIGAVAKAFNDVHAMAVRIAGDQALLRQNLDTIVVNLSRRTQSLVDRQLGELEGLEQRERDPDQLSALFRIDHMATRVRRHAESLLVLAGVQEMRKQTSSAPVLDVVRTAVGEVEQYPRVKFGVMPTDLVSANAVDDIAHLLAELIDNATEFSAPSTPVRVTSQPLLGGGLRIQVTDSGLGVPADQLEMLNQRLADVSDIDVATSRTLGLYVVARLSAKHGIRVRLEPGASGGMVAQVDLPANLIHSPLDSEVDLPGAPATNQYDPLTAPAHDHLSTPSRPAYPPPEPTTDPLGRPAAAPTPEPTRFSPAAPSARPAPEPLHSAQAFTPESTQALTPESTQAFSPATSPAESTGPMFPSASSDQAQGDSPIFESVRSAWFGGDKSSDWSSPADAGWKRAAEVLRSAEEAAAARWSQPPAQQPTQQPGQLPAQPSTRPPSHRRARPPAAGTEWPASPSPSSPAEPTRVDASAPAGTPVGTAGVAGTAENPAVNAAGLPVRRRGASLVPGSISEQPESQAKTRRPTPPTKSADSVSSTLASLQRGVGRGRQETGGWVPKRPSDPERSRQ